MRKRRLLCLGVALFVVVAAASADYLMVPNTTNDRVMLFNEYDGALVNPMFINLAPISTGTAMHPIVVGSEIWVSDQSYEGVMRWSLDGTTYLGDVSFPGALALSNPAGIEVVGNTAYIADRGNNRIVTADITTHTAYGNFNVGFDGSGTPYDVLFVNHLGYGNELLIGDGSTTGDADNIDVFTLTGTYRRTFHNSTGNPGIDQPQQTTLAADGKVLAAGSVAPYGVYEYDIGGNQVNYWARTEGTRGVHPLGNGNILFTDGSGVHIINRASGAITDVMTGIAARHIERIVPEPAALLLVLAGVIAGRRR